MNAEQAKIAADTLCGLWEGESRATVQVLEAVKGNREYKPDAKSRTAWQIATHLATADMWFIDSIVSGAFHFDAGAAKKVEASFVDGDQLADFYRKTFP